MDHRLSEALQILCVSAIEEVTPSHVNQLIASKPNQESWIKYAFHYVKMITGDSLPKDTEVFQEQDDDDDYQIDEENVPDDLNDIVADEEAGPLQVSEETLDGLHSPDFEPYLPDRHSLWSARRRNLENSLSYLPADIEVADEFELLSKYYALEIYRRSLIAYDSHEFTYEFFEESMLEMSNFEKLEIQILKELRYIGVDNDEGGFGVKFNRYIREFTQIMKEQKQ